MKEKELKNIIKEVVKECVNEVKGQIPKGKLAQLNPNIVNKVTPESPKNQSKSLPPKKVKENNDDGYDEKEEVRLIKGLQLIINKLIDMHKDVKVSSEDEKIDEDKWIQKAIDPKHKGYCSPTTKSTCTPKRKALAKRFKKGLTELKQECEMYFMESNGPQYNVASQTQMDTSIEDKAKEIQHNPRVNEADIQCRSYTTVKDLPQNPKNVFDPKVPKP